MTDWDQDRWSLDGALTVDEVPLRHEESLRQRRSRGLPQEIDLEGVEETDSSALALLLEWLSWAEKAGQRLRFRNPPESLRAIAELSDTDDILGWSGERKREGTA